MPHLWPKGCLLWLSTLAQGLWALEASRGWARLPQARPCPSGPHLRSAVCPQSCSRAAGRSPGSSGRATAATRAPRAGASRVDAALHRLGATGLRETACHGAVSPPGVPTAGRDRAGLTAPRVPRPAWRRRISSRDSLTPAGGGKHFVATRWPAPPLPRRPSPALRPAAPARCPGPGLSSAPRRLAGPPEPVLAGSRVLAAAEGPSCCADPLTRASFPRILRRLLRCLLAPHVPADENLVSSRETLAVFCPMPKGTFPFLKAQDAGC